MTLCDCIIAVPVVIAICVNVITGLTNAHLDRHSDKGGESHGKA